MIGKRPAARLRQWVGCAAAAVALALLTYVVLALVLVPTISIRTAGPVREAAAADLVESLRSRGWTVVARTADGTTAIDAYRPLLGPPPSLNGGLGDGGGLYLDAEDLAFLRSYRWSTHSFGVLADLADPSEVRITVGLPGIVLDTNGERTSLGGATWHVPPRQYSYASPVGNHPRTATATGFGGRWRTVYAKSLALVPEHVAVAVGLLVVVALARRRSASARG